MASVGGFFSLGVIAVCFAGHKIKFIACAQAPQANNSAGNIVVVPVHAEKK